MYIVCHQKKVIKKKPCQKYYERTLSTCPPPPYLCPPFPLSSRRICRHMLMATRIMRALVVTGELKSAIAKQPTKSPDICRITATHHAKVFSMPQMMRLVSLWGSRVGAGAPAKKQSHAVCVCLQLSRRCSCVCQESCLPSREERGARWGGMAACSSWAGAETCLFCLGKGQAKFGQKKKFVGLSL